jgi:hypothetical protein
MADASVTPRSVVTVYTTVSATMGAKEKEVVSSFYAIHAKSKTGV